jgi:hypothetical protein
MSALGPLDALRLIQEDAKADAGSFDGQPMTGLAVGTQFGNVLASIDALARILAEHIRAADGPE